MEPKIHCRVWLLVACSEPFQMLIASDIISRSCVEANIGQCAHDWFGLIYKSSKSLWNAFKLAHKTLWIDLGTFPSVWWNTQLITCCSASRKRKSVSIATKQSCWHRSQNVSENKTNIRIFLYFIFFAMRLPTWLRNFSKFRTKVYQKHCFSSFSISSILIAAIH